MKGDRKLRLVSGDEKRTEAGDPAGPEESAWLEGEAPVTEEERLEAERTREALERGDEPVSSSLRAAHHPPRLEDDEHDTLLSRALGDPLAKPTRAEERPAALLRDALERKSPGSAGDDGPAADLAALARALQGAWKPSALPPLHNEALIARALAGGRRRRASEVAGLVVGVLALAAGVAFLLTRGPDKPFTSALPHPTASVVAQASLIRARSTMDLFDVSEPFPRSGGESSRIDRIAGARAADLRANRYTTWGVR